MVGIDHKLLPAPTNLINARRVVLLAVAVNATSRVVTYIKHRPHYQTLELKTLKIYRLRKSFPPNRSSYRTDSFYSSTRSSVRRSRRSSRTCHAHLQTKKKLYFSQIFLLTVNATDQLDF